MTAGNASGINDGAAATVVVSEAIVEEFNLNPLARSLGMATAGVPPRIMGIGPVPATRKLLERTGFRSVTSLRSSSTKRSPRNHSLASVELGLPDDAEHVNPNGGAISIGHPLGMSGTRLVGTVARETARRDGRYGLATMCIGVGQGIAMLLERTA